MLAFMMVPLLLVYVTQWAPKWWANHQAAEHSRQYKTLTFFVGQQYVRVECAKDIALLPNGERTFARWVDEAGITQTRSDADLVTVYPGGTHETKDGPEWCAK